MNSEFMESIQRFRCIQNATVSWLMVITNILLHPRCDALDIRGYPTVAHIDIDLHKNST